jgi:2-dehydropantoate 2-reductase
LAKTSIVLIQNGLGVEEPILAAFPANPLLSVVAYLASSQVSTGKITMIGRENLVMAEYRQPNVDGEQQRDLLFDLFLKGGVSMEVVPDIERPRWQKLILWAGNFFWPGLLADCWHIRPSSSLLPRITAIASLCVATDLDTSGVTTYAPTAELLKNVMRDIVTVANAYGYDFDKDTEVEKMFQRVATLQAYKPSMYLDSVRNQPMETEVIFGNPLRRAKEKSVSVPYLETMYALCSAINAKKQGRLWSWGRVWFAGVIERILD